MGESEEVRRKKFIIKFVYYAFLLVIVWFIFRYLIGWFLPFLFAFLIAALVQPIVYLLHKKLGLNRKAAGVATVLAAVILLGFAFFWGITKMFHELAAVLQVLPTLIVQFTESLHHLTGSISGYFDSLPTDISQKLIGILSNAESELSKLSSLSSGILSMAGHVASGVPNFLLKLIITIIAACFISMDYGSIRGFILHQLSPEHQEWVIELKEFFIKTIGRLLLAYLTIMCVTFVELSIGLTLIGIQHSIMVAFLIAIVDILPVLGTGTVMIPWILIELVTGNYTLFLCLVILYAFITVVRNIMEPKLVGYHLGLHPLITLMAMFVGLSIMGVLGMFLFPIAIIIIKHLQDAGKIRIWRD